MARCAAISADDIEEAPRDYNSELLLGAFMTCRRCRTRNRGGTVIWPRQVQQSVALGTITLDWLHRSSPCDYQGKHNQPTICAFFAAYDLWLTPTMAEPLPTHGYLHADVDDLSEFFRRLWQFNPIN